MAQRLAGAMMAPNRERGKALQAGRISRTGIWLGVFAIAMLFVGPPIGQWRAAQLASAAAQLQVAAPERAVHDQHAAHGGSASHAGHLAHQRTDQPRPEHGGHTRQVGALTLDHCGYCHLVASFAALPATFSSLPLLRWETQAPPQAIYLQPASEPRHSRRARAPPMLHA